MPFFTVLASAANISYGIVAVMLYKKQLSIGKAAKIKIKNSLIRTFSGKMNLI